MGFGFTDTQVQAMSLRVNEHGLHICGSMRMSFGHADKRKWASDLQIRKD